MQILSSRALLRPTDWDRSVAFYRDTLGLRIYREFPRGVVFFLGGGFLEVSGHGAGGDAGPIALWLQVPSIAEAHAQLVAAKVPIDAPPRREAWGLLEMRARDPDGVRLVFVEVPPEHPLRRDTRAHGDI